MEISALNGIKPTVGLRPFSAAVGRKYSIGLEIRPERKSLSSPRAQFFLENHAIGFGAGPQGAKGLQAPPSTRSRKNAHYYHVQATQDGWDCFWSGPFAAAWDN
jgi:hypothetical protein